MDKPNKIFVDLYVLKNEVKSIKKITKNLKHTQILNILIKSLNFQSYDDYKKGLKAIKKENDENIVYFKNADIKELTLIENKIISKINSNKNELNINNKIDKIFFIRNHINERIKCNIDYYPRFNLFNILSIYKNKYPKFFNLIDKDKNINKDLLESLIYFLSNDLIPNIKLNDINLFANYIHILDNNKSLDLSKIKESHPLEHRIFSSAISNDDSHEESMFFQYLFDVYRNKYDIPKVAKSIIDKINEINLDKKIEPNLNIITYNNELLNIKQKINKLQPIYLGEKSNLNKADPSGLLNFRRKIINIEKNKSLNLNVEDSNKNRLILGLCGTGKSELVYNIIFQYIIHGKSVIHLLETLDNGGLFKIMQLCLISGRINDFCWFKAEDENIEQKILSAYKSNKVVCIIPSTVLSLECNNNLIKIFKTLNNLKSLNINNGNKKLKNSISFSFLNFDKLKDCYNDILTDSEKIVFTVDSQDIRPIQSLKIDIYKSFPTIFIMRQEYFYLNEEYLDLMDVFNKSRLLNAGDFFFIRNKYNQFHFDDLNYCYNSNFIDINLYFKNKENYNLFKFI